MAVSADNANRLGLSHCMSSMRVCVKGKGGDNDTSSNNGSADNVCQETRIIPSVVFVRRGKAGWMLPL